MKVLLPKSFFIAFVLLLFTHTAESACSASFTKTVSGLTVTFTNTSTTTSGFPNMMIYQWNFGDATYSSQKNPVKTYSTPGAKIVQLTINDSFGCTKTIIDTVFLVSTTPTCNASFTKSISGSTVTFTNTSTTSGTVTSAVYYNWYFSDGTSSTLKNPVKTFTTSGVKTAQMSLYDSSTHCWSSFTDSFAVGSASGCVAGFTKSISGSTVTFTNTSTTSGNQLTASYYWSFSNGLTSTLKNPIITFPSGGVKSATVTIYDSSISCSASFTDTFTVTASGGGCVANFTKTINGNTVTLASYSSLNSLGDPNDLTRTWYFSDGTSYGPTSLAGSYPKTFLTVGVKWARLEISDAYGCTSSKTDTFTLNGNCYASFNKTVNGLAVTFSGTATTFNASATKYNYTFSDGTSAQVRHTMKAFATPGLKYIQFTVSDTIQGCSATKTDSVMLYGSSTPCSSSFNRTVISPLVIRMNSTASNSNGTSAALSYSWATSEGGYSGPSSSPTYTHTFTTPGVKWVNHIITDSSGCTSSKVDTFTVVSSSCAANFTKTISGLSVTFNNTSLSTNGSAAGLSYYWYFSDGTTSTLKNPVKTFTSGGIKTATLTISDSLQGCFSSKTDTIVLSSSSSCAASFIFSASAVTPLTINFTSTSTNSNGSAAGLKYRWEFSDGTVAGPFLVSSFIKTFATPGVKWARLNISDSSTGCFATRIDSFMLTASNCAAKFTKSISGMTVSLTSTSTNTNGSAAGLSYYWYFSDGTSSTHQNPIKTFTTSGIKTIILTITDTIQGCFSSKTDTIVISSSCVASFTKSISGLTVSLNNTSTNTNGSSAGLTYTWLFSDGTSSGAKNPVKTFATGGVKIITLNIADSASGCFASRTDTVLLTPLCSASFSLAVDTTAPFHFFILNTSIIRTTSTFFWNFGDGSTSTAMTPTHTYANFGMYYVCLTVSDSLCTSTYCDSIGMDSTGRLLKQGAFGFQTLNFTTVSGSTGVDEIKSDVDYTIYPNPAHSDVYVEFSLRETADMHIQLTDLTGKTILNQYVDVPSGKHKERISLSDLKPSVYFLTIQSASGQKTYKLIKN